uniref:WAP domain-containing protein n=1 Tax=Panagrellus redivivus TaxID=6233 RepID=A0A7E4UZ62_PANRE
MSTFWRIATFILPGVHAMRVKLALLSFLAVFVIVLVQECKAASCNSNEYCPLGWSVKRKADGSTQTCVPHDPKVKCGKPYTCVASKCGINFCCANDKMLARLKEIEEDQEDADNDEL